MNKIKLYPHNQAAFENLTAMIEKEGRGAVIQPTGTGKSFIALALMEQHPRSSFLYLSPSTYIFQQLYRHADDALEHAQMVTYQRLCRMSTEEIMELNADYIILDEFHRCGADEWGAAVRTLLYYHGQAALVGFTATPIRYLDQAGVRDMAEELFGACVANYYSLRQAMSDGVLPVPQYILCDILMGEKLKNREAVLEQHASSSQAYVEAACMIEEMRRNLTHAVGVEEIFAQHLPHHHAKLIVFCRNLEHISHAQADMLRWLRPFGKVRCYSCRSDDGEADTELLGFMQDTNTDAVRLLFCVDMLNEGLHIRDVDGVVMLRPTASPTVYLQQIGRCLASSPDAGSTPVIFDLVNNHRSARVEGCDDILCPVQDGADIERHHEKRSVVPFLLDSHLAQFDTLLDKFDNLLSRNGRWSYLFSILQAYVLQFGTYPRHREYSQGVAIGAWLTHQINDLKAGTLPPERASALMQLPGWDDYLRARPRPCSTARQRRVRWRQSLQRMNAYLKCHDGVYPTIASDSALYYWCRYYRRRYQAGQLPMDIKSELESLPNWAEYVRKPPSRPEHRGAPLSLTLTAKLLAQYTAEHNGRNPPYRFVVDGFALGKRINAYRVKKKKNELTSEAQQLLEEAGIIWTIHEKSRPRSFEEYYEELKRYHASEGHILVPQSYITPDTQCKLGLFIHRMRLAYKNQKGYNITPEQIQMLAQLDMFWSVPKRTKQNKEVQYDENTQSTQP